MIRLPGVNGECCICTDALAAGTEHYRCIRSVCESGKACAECWDKTQDQSACPVCRVPESKMTTDDPLILAALFDQGHVGVLDRSIKQHARDAQWFVRVFKGADRQLSEALVRFILSAWWEFDVSVLDIVAVLESKYSVRLCLPGPEFRHSREQMKRAIRCLEAMEWMVKWRAGRGLLHQGLMYPIDQNKMDTWSHCVRMADSRAHFDLYYKLATGQAQFPRDKERDLFVAAFSELWSHMKTWALDWLCPLALDDQLLRAQIRPILLELAKDKDSIGLLQLVLAENRTLIFKVGFSDQKLEESAARYPLRYRLDSQGLFALFRGDSEWTRVGQDLPFDHHECLFAFEDRKRNVLYWGHEQDVDDDSKFTVVDMSNSSVINVKLTYDGAELTAWKDGNYRDLVPVPGKLYKFVNFAVLAVTGEDKVKKPSKRKYFRLE